MKADKELFTQRLKLRDKSFDIKTIKGATRTLFFCVAHCTWHKLSHCHFQSLEHVR